jgi:beta-N-acetylhexosaminidase
LRHRDLPARVRRRQAATVVAIVAARGAGAYLLLWDGDQDEEQPVSLERLAGQTIVGKLGTDGPDRVLLRTVRRGRLGGVIVAPRDEETLRRDVARLQQAASAGGNRPLLVMIDQEGGEVKRLAEGPPELSPRDLGESGDPEAARSEGEQTGRFLAALGVNVDLAPVLDVAHPETTATIADRTFGDDSATVAQIGGAFAEGLRSGGVVPTAKHFPGLGYAMENTDLAPVAIGESRSRLEADLEPFRAAVEAGVPLLMVSTAVYPALGSGDPAAFAGPIVGGELREGLGFDGAVITDDLEGAAVTAVTSPDRAAVRALEAGVDLALLAGTERASRRAFERVVSAAKRGRLDRSLLEDAYARVTDLKDSLPSG